MIPLLRKELRILLPLQILMIFARSGDLLYRPFTERLDEASWLHISSYIAPGAGGGQSFDLLIFGILVAYSLFPREHDEGTIDFLHSLPVSRAKIFVSKVLAGAIALFSPIIVLTFTDWLLQSRNPQTWVGEQWRFDVALPIALLHMCVCWVALCHGLLMSFFRRFGLIPYALLAWIVLLLSEISPTIALLDVTNVVVAEYEGQSVVIPWGLVALHLTLALGALTGAALLWMGRAEWFTKQWAKLQTSISGRISLGCSTVFIVFVLIGVLVASSGFEEGVEEQQQRDEPRGVSFEVARSETTHFHFTYPVNLRGRALAIIEEADAIHSRLSRDLGMTSRERIIVDLTDVSGHHEGITSGSKLRVGLVSEHDDRHLVRTFAHELTHAFQFQLTDQRIRDGGSVGQFFFEGSAEWFSFEAVPNEAVRLENRRSALAGWSRHRVEFQDLADRGELRARFDPQLVYSLGETWTAALVDVCGRDAPGRALRAMGRENAPQGLGFRDFWQDTLQAVDCDLEAVLNQWERSLGELREQEVEFLEMLPRMGGGFASYEGYSLRFVATLDRPPLPEERYPRAQYYIRVRENPNDSDARQRVVRGRVVGERRIEFRVPRVMVTGRELQFQFGVEFHPEAWPYWEPWQWGVLPPQ